MALLTARQMGGANVTHIYLCNRHAPRDLHLMCRRCGQVTLSARTTIISTFFCALESRRTPSAHRWDYLHFTGCGECVITPAWAVQARQCTIAESASAIEYNVKYMAHVPRARLCTERTHATGSVRSQVARTERLLL